MTAAALRSRLLALILCSVLSSVASAQFASPDEADDVSKSGANGPPAAVAMEVWVVSFHKVKSVVEDDQFGRTLRDAANLPADLGDRNDVRKLLDEWERQGVVGRLEHYRASARSGQTALIVPTERTPTIVGTAVSDKGRTNNIQFQQAGTSLKLKPRVVGEHVIDVDVEYENSELFDSDSVNISEVKLEAPQPAVGTRSVSIQSVVAVPNGHVVLASFLSNSQQTFSKLVLVGAEVLEQ